MHIHIYYLLWTYRKFRRISRCHREEGKKCEGSEFHIVVLKESKRWCKRVYRKIILRSINNMVDLSCCLLLDVFDFFSFVGCRVDDNID